VNIDSVLDDASSLSRALCGAYLDRAGGALDHLASIPAQSTINEALLKIIISKLNIEVAR
jgi:hypothetical protein